MRTIHRLKSAVAVGGVTVGASLAGPALSNAAASSPSHTLPSVTALVTGLEQLHMSPTNLLTAARDYQVLSYDESTSGYSGLGPILQALSQVNGIKGTYVGDEFSELATNCSNEDSTIDQNQIDGLHALQANSASNPAPFNTLVYNLAAVLLKDSSSTPATSGQRASTSTGALPLQNILSRL